MNNQKYEVIENLSLQKSNSLVSAKYKSSLIENQIMAIALTRIEVNYAENENVIAAKLYPGELKRLIGDPTNIYKILKKVSKTMTGHTMFLEDGNGNFKAFAVVNNAEYIDGVFTVEFNKNLREHILGLEKNYTSLELAVLTRFKRNSSFRIYELLKSHLYKSKKEINNGRVDVEYNISELRFMIGLANGDDPGVKNALSVMKVPNWDELYGKLDKKDRKYETWFDFQRYVIKPAQEELAEKSNIRFEYEGLREGRKMARIRFYIYPHTAETDIDIQKRKRILEENGKGNFSAYKESYQMELPKDLPGFRDLYEEFIGHNYLTDKDIDILLKESGFDKEKVRWAILEADKVPEVHNYIGFIVHLIRNGKNEPIPVASGDADKGYVVREIRESVLNNKKDLAEKFWEKIKRKDNFDEFVSELEKMGVSFQNFDLVYEAEEKTEIYTAWIRKEGVHL